MIESSSLAVSSRRSREEGERLVSEYKRSGMTRVDFCRAQGISPHTLDYYRQKHGRREQQGAAQLLPVELVSPLPTGGSCLRVELANGRRIAVAEGFDAMLLKRLIAALEG
jgi:transposase-like protein